MKPPSGSEKQTQFKPNFRKAHPIMNVNLYVIEDYDNETAFRPKKINPIKANFKRPLFSAKIGNIFPKKLRKLGKGMGISLIWTSSSTFQES